MMASELHADAAAERAVVGSILIDAAGRSGGLDLCGHPIPPREPYADAALSKAKARLLPEHFHDQDARLIYEAILAADAQGLAVDVVTVAPFLGERGFFRDASAYEVLWELADPDVTPSAANVQHYATAVLEGYARRELANVAGSLAEAAKDATEPVVVVLDGAEARLHEARRQAEAQEPFDLAAEVGEVRDRLAGRAESRWRWRTGVELLDRRLGGIGAGELWVLAGRSGHMKTALACNIMWHTLQAGHRVAMVRYEEQAASILLRLASLASNVPYGDLYRDETGEADVAAFDAGLQRLATDYAGMFELHVGSTLEQIEGVIGRFSPALVVFDTVQAQAEQVGRRHRERRDLEVQSVCEFVSRLSVRPGHEHAAVLISQLQKGSGRPQMRELRESGAIEEAADVVLLLYWEHKDDADAPADEIEVRIAKNRIGGVLGAATCRVDPGTQRFGPQIRSSQGEDE